MAKLLGSLIGGEPFALDVTARTRTLKLHKYELATLDFSALSAAPNLESISSGQSPMAVGSLAPLAACPKLNSLSIPLVAKDKLRESLGRESVAIELLSLL